MTEQDVRLADDSCGQQKNEDTQKFFKLGLDQITIQQITLSGILRLKSLETLLDLIRLMLEHLALRQVRRIISTNPMNLLRPIDRIGSCLRSLIHDAKIDPDDAKDILEQEFEIIDVAETDFRLKCGILANVIQDKAARLAFLLAHPGYFLIPHSQLSEKQHMDLSDYSHARIWKILMSDGETTIKLERRCFPPKPKPPPPAEKNEAIPTPIPPTDPCPTFNETFMESESSYPPPADTTPPEEEPTPAIEEQAAVPIEEFGLEVIEKDTPVRVQFPETRTSPSAIELDDKNGAYVRSVIKFLTTKEGAGIHWDIARPLVVYRPWLADPDLNNLRTLEVLSELGIRGGLMLDALRHDGLFALGFYALEPMLTELTENRDLPLPDDIRDIAIPRRIILRRLKALKRMEIEPSDPRFKPALYAKTEREFK
jgi:hypothetical protein